MTLGVAAGCALGSTLAAVGPVLEHPLLAWMVHVDVQHLAVDLVVWLSLGMWMERRAGWRRMLLWVCAGLATSLLAHLLVYPAHATLFGLSAIAFFVFAAGAAACALDEWCGRLLLCGIALVLWHEWMTGGTSAAAAMVEFGFGESVRLLGAGYETTPVTGVHVACAIGGAVFGGLARVGAWRAQCREAVGAPSQAYLISKP